MDVVILSKAAQIRAVEASGDVDRLHVFPTAQLPWWTRKIFQASRFHDPASDTWFLAFEPTSSPDYEARRTFLVNQIAEGYSPEDVARVAELLRRDADDSTLAGAMVQIVMRRFTKRGEPVPEAMVDAAAAPLQTLGEALLPGRYAKARKAALLTTDYSQQHLVEGSHPIDAGNHNLGEIVQTTSGALRLVAKNLHSSVDELFTENPQTPQVPRIAVRRSTLGGLLTFPTIPGWTVVIMKIAKAAVETGDLNFVFGAGMPTRLCVFQDFFLAFMKDLQQHLRGDQP